MRKKLIALAGTAFLVAACETVPEDTGAVSGSGADSNPTPVVQETAALEPVASPAARTPQEELIDVGDRVFFDFDRHNIRPDGEATLQRQADLLRAYSNLTITISGHCDERGTREYNLALGERRALAARNWLVAAGVDNARITTISYGKERPIVLGHTKAAWAQNRVAITTLN